MSMSSSRFVSGAVGTGAAAVRGPYPAVGVGEAYIPRRAGAGLHLPDENSTRKCRRL